MDEQREFTAWLQANNRKLRAYAPDELARLAFFCGFSLEVICPGVIDRVTHVQRLLAFAESPLADNWMRVVEHWTDEPGDTP